MPNLKSARRILHIDNVEQLTSLIFNPLNKDGDEPYLILVDHEDGLIEKVRYDKLTSISLNRHENYEVEFIEETGGDQDEHMECIDIMFLSPLLPYLRTQGIEVKMVEPGKPSPTEDVEKVEVLNKDENPLQHYSVAEVVKLMERFNRGGDWDTWRAEHFMENAWAWFEGHAEEIVTGMYPESVIDAWVKGFQYASGEGLTDGQVREIAIIYCLEKLLENTLCG